MRWQLVAIDSSGTVVQLNPVDTFYVMFKPPRKVQGGSQGLCNNDYTCMYTLHGGNSIRLDSVRSTAVYCPRSRYDYYLYDKLMQINSFGVYLPRLYLYLDGSNQEMIFLQTH